jgi:hypothetical protein
MQDTTCPHDVVNLSPVLIPTPAILTNDEFAYAAWFFELKNARMVPGVPES